MASVSVVPDYRLSGQIRICSFIFSGDGMNFPDNFDQSAQAARNQPNPDYQPFTDRNLIAILCNYALGLKRWLNLLRGPEEM